MKTVAVNDYSNNMVALTIDVPDHWESASSVNWYFQGAIGINLEIKVFDPNGPDRFWLRPSQKFDNVALPFMGQSPGSVPIMNGSQAIQNFVLPEYQRQYPGLRLTSVENIPISPARKAELEQTCLMMKMVNPNMNFLCDSATAFFEYTQNGMDISEAVNATCEGIDSQDPFTGGRFSNWTLTINSYRSRRKKSKDMSHEANALSGSIRLNPQWQRLRDDTINQSQRQQSQQQSQQAQHNNNMWKSQMEHQQKMFKMQQDTFNDINKTRQETFQNTQDSMSNINKNWTDVLRGKREVYDPYNNRYMDVDNNYHYTWMNEYGNVIQTDKSYYDPNREGDYGNWRQV